MSRVHECWLGGKGSQRDRGSTEFEGKKNAQECLCNTKSDGAGTLIACRSGLHGAPRGDGCGDGCSTLDNAEYNCVRCVHDVGARYVERVPDDVAQERLLAVSPPLRTLRALGRLSNPLKDEPQCVPPPGIRYVEPSIRADPACAFEWVGGCPGCFDVQLPEGERPALPEVDGKPFKEASARLGTLPPRNVEFTRIKRDGLVAPKVATLQVVKVTSLLPLGGGSERWRGLQCSPEWDGNYELIRHEELRLAGAHESWRCVILERWAPGEPSSAPMLPDQADYVYGAVERINLDLTHLDSALDDVWGEGQPPVKEADLVEFVRFLGALVTPYGADGSSRSTSVPLPGTSKLAAAPLHSLHKQMYREGGPNGAAIGRLATLRDNVNDVRNMGPTRRHGWIIPVLNTLGACDRVLSIYVSGVTYPGPKSDRIKDVVKQAIPRAGWYVEGDRVHRGLGRLRPPGTRSLRPMRWTPDSRSTMPSTSRLPWPLWPTS